VAAVASAIESGQPISPEQVQIFSDIIKGEIAELAKELRGKSEDGKAAYPKNLTLGNHAEYICLPTLVYELDYPRQESTNWWYVAEKSAATFGILIIMQVISQAYVYPLVMQTIAMKEAGMSLDERLREFPFIVVDMVLPILVEQLLTWYVIWECILNVLAEVFKFAGKRHVISIFIHS
jgi:sterol O-acyltransferase